MGAASLLNTSKVVDIVVGSGALGAFLGADLEQMGPVGFVDVVPVRTPVIVESMGRERLLDASEYVSLNSGSPEALLAFASAKTIFVCVPPQDTSSVVSFLANTNLWPNAEVFFCGNGLVQNAEAILTKNPSVSLCRALFHAGFQRRVSVEGTRVVHAGGARVEWGMIAGQNPPAPRTRTLRWEFCENINQKEYEKFFINLVLASVIGPRPLPNGALWEHVSETQVRNAANDYCALLGADRFFARDFVSAISLTVNQTATNINSVSAARSSGNNEAWEAMLFQLRGLVEAASNAEAATRFWRFVTLKENG